MSKRKRLERMNERLAEQAGRKHRAMIYWRQEAAAMREDAKLHELDAGCLRRQLANARRWAAAWKHAATMERCARVCCSETAASHEQREKVLADLLRRWDGHFVTMGKGPICELQRETREALGEDRCPPIQ